MQKSKSLIVKILSLMFVICCSLVLAVGATACAKDPITVKSATVNEKGELILVLTDNTTVNAGVLPKGDKGEDGADGSDNVSLQETCLDGGSHKLVEHVIKYANCSEEGLAVNVCDICKGFQTVKLDKDAEVHGAWESKFVYDTDEGYGMTIVEYNSFGEKTSDSKDPTCKEDGYIKEVCAKCGEVVIDTPVAKLDHKLNGVSQYKWMKGATGDCACEDGTFEGYICLLCLDLDKTGTALGNPYTNNAEKNNGKPIYTAPTDSKHTATADWTVTLPTASQFGKLEGVCAECGCAHSVELPKLDKTNYTYDADNCQAQVAQPTETYTLKQSVVDGLIHGYSKEIKVVNNITVTHKFNESLSFYMGEEVSFATIGSYIGNGMNWSMGAPGNCQTKAAIGYTCADCSANVGIMSTGDHNFVEATAPVTYQGKTYALEQAADCLNDGWTKLMVCSLCNTPNVTKYGTPATEHHLVAVGEPVYNASTQKYTIAVDCDHENCPTSSFAPVVATYVSEVSPAKCEEAKVEKYSYEVTDGIEYVSISVGKPLGHKVKDGLFIAKGQDTTPEFYADNNLKALFENKTLTWSMGIAGTCSAKQQAGFTCTAAGCGESIGFYAFGEHTYESEPVKLNGVVDKREADCDDFGYTAKYLCKDVAKCNGEPKYEGVTSELGHNLVATAEPVYDSTTQKYTIAVKCDRCTANIAPLSVTAVAIGDVIAGYNEGKAIEKVEFDATCQRASSKLYKYTLNAGTSNAKTVVVEIFANDMKGHLVDGTTTRFYAGQNTTPAEYTSTVKALINAGKLNWTMGVAGTCSTKAAIGFECADCHQSIGFYAFGEHKYAADFDKDAEGKIISQVANHKQFGYDSKKTCTECKKEDSIVYTNYKPIVAHEWTVKSIDGTKVKLECSCGEDLEVDVISEVYTAGDCENKGYTTYEYKAEGVTKYVDVPDTEEPSHNFIPNPAETYEVVEGDKTYIITFQYCTKCNEVKFTRTLKVA